MWSFELHMCVNYLWSFCFILVLQCVFAVYIFSMSGAFVLFVSTLSTVNSCICINSSQWEGGWLWRSDIFTRYGDCACVLFFFLIIINYDYITFFAYVCGCNVCIYLNLFLFLWLYLVCYFTPVLLFWKQIWFFFCTRFLTLVFLSC